VFLGEFEHSVDDKGRLAVPAKFRPYLSDGLVVTRGLDACLFVWSMDEWQALAEKLAKLPMMQADVRRIGRLFFSGAIDARLDKMGRFVIPQYLREYATITDQVYVVGVFNSLEIWNPQAWQGERSLAEGQSSELAEHLANLGI